MGAFDFAYGPAYDVSEGTAGVRLDFPVGFDDHQRPPYPLWQRYHYPDTQVGLFLYMNGTVKQTTTFEVGEYFAADDVTAGGHQGIWDSQSWQAQVLAAAGYVLEGVNAGLTPIVPPSPGSGAYGDGSYGAGTYG